MAVLQIQRIHLAYGDRDILNDVAFTLDSSSRAALAGPNGCGKSTLLKVISGQITADGYENTATRGLRISYLPQSEIVYGELSVYDEVELVYRRFDPVLEEMRSIEEALVGGDGQQQLTRLSQIHDTLLNDGYHDRKRVIEEVLFGLGFSSDELKRPCSTFSGGWQMRIALAKILVDRPDIMLLDEPTNFLDFEARLWLKNYLKAFEGGLMLVSHDQGFLDDTVDEVYELFEGTLTRYRGNYTTYLETRKAQIATLQAQARAQEDLIRRNEQFIERFRSKASKSRQVQSRVKMLERIEQVTVPSHLRELSFSFRPAPKSGNDVVIINTLTKRYGDLVLYEDFSLMVTRGERLAVTGRNGAGKSTLLRLIAGEDADFSGSVRLGANVEAASFTQKSTTDMHDTNTLLEEISHAASTEDSARARTLLGSFLFEGDDVFKSVGVLSGGERSRLALLKILLAQANLLILDEPTNHLDINAKQMLLKALKAWDGTIIFVSHDRTFIDELATTVLYLSEGEQPVRYEGTYSHFLQRLAEQNTAVLPQQSGQERPKEGLLAYREANQRKNRIATLKREEERMLALHHQLEQRIGEVEAQMALQENYSDGERIKALVAQKADFEGELGTAEEHYLTLLSEREELEDSDG